MGWDWCVWHLGGVRYRANNNNVLKFKSQCCSSRKIGPIQTKFYMCSWLDPWGTGNWPLGNCIHCWRCEPNFTTRVPGACNDNPDRPKQGCCTNRLFWRWLVALVARWWYIYDVLLYVLVYDCIQLSSFKSVEAKGSRDIISKCHMVLMILFNNTWGSKNKWHVLEYRRSQWRHVFNN